MIFLYMNTLVQILDNKVTTTSLQVAEYFKKEHKIVLKAIDDLMIKIDRHNFNPISYEDSYGRTQRAYRMQKDDFVLLAMGFTGKKAFRFKLQYIEAFNVMQAQLAQPQRELTRIEILRQALESEERAERLELESKAKDKVIEDQNVLHGSILRMKATESRTTLKALKDDIGVEINHYVGRLFKDTYSYRQKHVNAHELYRRMTGKVYLGANKSSLESKENYLWFLKEQVSRLESDVEAVL